MLSRREMGALCAALLLCLLLSLGAGWAKGQLDAADALAADTLRLHIRASHPHHSCKRSKYKPPIQSKDILNAISSFFHATI